MERCGIREPDKSATYALSMALLLFADGRPTTEDNHHADGKVVLLLDGRPIFTLVTPDEIERLDDAILYLADGLFEAAEYLEQVVLDKPLGCCQ
ncbi:MAG: hypothetical protein NTY63_07580 [Candidatus Bipolaricaulota bacterium]|nr:hypothetical protein [Candidatus Bipolaricaulota bacterium]